jgi:hypothetical protein
MMSFAVVDRMPQSACTRELHPTSSLGAPEDHALGADVQAAAPKQLCHVWIIHWLGQLPATVPSAGSLAAVNAPPCTSMESPETSKQTSYRGCPCS